MKAEGNGRKKGVFLFHTDWFLKPEKEKDVTWL